MKQNPNATRDASGRLKVGAAVGTGNDGYNRAQALADAEVDIVVVDTPDAVSYTHLTLPKSDLV